MPMTPEEVNDVLENLIDRTSVKQVVACLVAVCEAKAAHVKENWMGAGQTHLMWSKAAKRLEVAWKWIQV